MKIKNCLFYLLLIFFLVMTILYFTTEYPFEIFGWWKPITMMQYSGFLLFALLINRIKGIFDKLTDSAYWILVAISFLFLMGTAFELLWSFFYWFSKYTISQGMQHIDAVMFLPGNPYVHQFSLNANTKIHAFLFFCALYFVYVLHRSGRGSLYIS